MPRSLSRLAIATMPIGPADRMLRIIGSMFAANRSASARRATRPAWPGSTYIGRIAQGFARRFLAANAARVSLGNELAFLFGQRCVQVEHKKHALRHKPSNECHVAREPVELGNQ